MHSLESTLQECYQTLDSLGIPYAANCKVISDPKLRRCWGSCRKQKDGSYTIKISSVLLEETVPLESLQDTLYHELLHTVPNAMNHRHTWLALAKKVSLATGLHIRPSAPASEKGVAQDFTKDPSVKFLCVCQGCGAEIVRYRKCDFARRPDKYRCSCGGKFKVIFSRF